MRDYSRQQPRMPKQNLRRRPRAGMAIVLVLGMLSITMALSYVMLRTRAQSELLQENFHRQGDAQLAAEAGMAQALKAISLSSWSGVDVPLSGSLDDLTTYRVTFVTGDSSLTASSADYAEYPFRLTITSVGTAVDASDSQIQTTYTIKSVVQLVRKKLAAQPDLWSTLQNFSVVQWNASRGAQIEQGMQVSGGVYLAGIPTIYSALDESSSRTQFTNDIRLMKNANVADYRPFTTWVYLPSSTGSTSKTNLSNMDTTTLFHSNTSTAAPVSHPGTVSTYRLYPGGKSYSIPNLSSLYGSEVKDVALRSDVVGNPLGVFRASSAIRFGNNAQLEGTFISPSSSQAVTIRGTNVVISGKNLPALQSDSTVRQLPVTLANFEVNVESGATCTINGLLMAWDQLEVQSHTSATKLTVNGRVFVNDFDMLENSGWVHSSSWWTWRLYLFNLQKYWTGPYNSSYFPIWLKLNESHDPKPILTFAPNSSGVSYHWHTWSQPIYQVADGDDGLRWNLISQQVVQP